MKAKMITKGISVILAAVMLLACLPCAFATEEGYAPVKSQETGDISDLLGYKFTIAGTDCEPRVFTGDLPMSLAEAQPLDEETANQILADSDYHDPFFEPEVEYYGTLSDGSMLVKIIKPVATALNYMVMGKYVYATPHICDEAEIYKDHKFERIITAYENGTLSDELLDEIANVLHFAVFDLADGPIMTTPSSEPTEPTSKPAEPTVEPTEPSSDIVEPMPEPVEYSSEVVEPMPEPIDPTGITVEPIEPSYAPSDPTVEPTTAATAPKVEPTQPSSDVLESMPKLIDDTGKGEYIPGDANGDGDVNVKDATLIQLYVVETIGASEINLTAARVCGGERVTVKDATSIQMKIVGIDVGW